MARHSPVKRAMREFDSHPSSLSECNSACVRARGPGPLTGSNPATADFERRMLMELHLYVTPVSSLLVAAFRERSANGSAPVFHTGDSGFDPRRSLMPP